MASSMLRVRVQGGLRDEASRLCLQVLDALSALFLVQPHEHSESTPSGPLMNLAPLHAWSSILSEECSRKEEDL